MSMSRENHQRLQVVLDAYGADPRRWPQGDRRDLAEMLKAIPQQVSEARQFDQVLSTATAPAGEPASFDAILSAIASDAPRQENVVLFRSPAPSRRAVPIRWLAAVPLAASLALGIYVGATGSLDAFLPTSVVGETLAAGEDPGDLSGISDIEAMTGDEVS
jgi:hypothetical protein